MSNIGQLAQDVSPQLQDQIAIWSTQNGQPRQCSLSALATLILGGVSLPRGLLSAASTYALRKTVAGTQNLTATPSIITTYDPNGATVLPVGGTALTQNVVTGLMQATRAIAGVNFSVSLVGSIASPRVLTLQVQTGPVGGTLYTSEFEAIAQGTGNAQCWTFQGFLQKPGSRTPRRSPR
ncbi:hypothetical protein [Paraburkholderia unamae]|uniref:Uncharacterized protein n=1 Tax=Paraburkholderia unamae TaxID=219649 RepID=A0ACC6RWM3_9BURK